MPHAKRFTFHRVERRIPMEIPVLIDGIGGARSECTFTENVMGCGRARVSVRRWEEKANLWFRLAHW